MRFSVVIPTHNRSEKLQQCLDALFAQEYSKKEYEIIVIDDGSQDDTQQVLKKLQKKSPVPLHIFSQENQGQAVARNKGIEAAQGEIILLIGDDIEVSSPLLKEHDRIHLLHPEESSAVLGFVTWHPKLVITPLMRFMERGGAVLGRWGGHQFAYDLLQGREVADYRFFYTANISLKRSLLTRFKFDPWFSGYGWEDIELGYRLSKEASMKLYYAPEAIAYHDHPMSEEQFIHRMRAIGLSTHSLGVKYPELGAVPSPRKQRIFSILSHPITLALVRPLSKNLYYYGLSKKYFLEGLKKEYNNKRK